ncbi:MAG: M20 family metallo-hydrolase [Calditrichaceae bacterium]|nr:M20 family metallo-hydrolase [Calditrichaceae bacterium]HES59112.1 M20/M25/M40 family metallo-hydrolase [Caldithrix sp.]
MKKNSDLEILNQEALSLLKSLIETPSISGQEDEAADLIGRFLNIKGIAFERKINNIWVTNTFFDDSKPTLLLNSHFDTVKPNAGWQGNPFEAAEKDGKLIGLGSNDAGASVVSLLSAFIYFKDRQDLNHNIIFAATAEEETSGANGITAILDELGKIDLAIVGEPTGMDMAVAEKGLIVIDCEAKGVSGHAARDLGVNAILKAYEDIEWFSNYKFDRISKFLGPVKMTVTMINAGYQHNVIPDRCTFTVDIRTTDAYTHDEILEIIRKNIKGEVARCSLRLNPSSIPEDHLLVKTALDLDIKTYGSPTLSDQALIQTASVKMGPGKSERSHTAEEFIYIEELYTGIRKYIELLENFLTK